ncbi:MAG TPA: hypothetical protein VN493_17060 [Thermoanaerobaculia bacterium]|nr:hypothetical protein [Thermoanaerobaculia bacterium]
MKKAILAVLALGLAVPFTSAPASAGGVYVPVIPPRGTDGSLHSTEVWVSNPAGSQRGFSTFFIPAATDGTTRGGSPEIPVPARRTFLLSNVGSTSGLLEVKSTQEMSVEAQLINTSPAGLQTRSSVPVISSVNTVGAGKTAHLVGLERDSARGTLSHLGVVNLGTQGAQCEIRLFRVDGTQIGSAVTLSFFALSLRQFDDALGALGEQRITDARVQVTCNQPFFVYAAVVNQPLGQIWFLSPSASTTAETGGTNPTPAPGNSLVFQKSGHLHTAIPPGNAKGTINIPIQQTMALKRMVIECDFIPGPWNSEKIPGNHAIIWLYRGKFRGNTVANVNAFGPNKHTIKMNQNVDLAAKQVTNAEVGLQLQQGKRYHLRYVYDAATNQITADISQAGTLLKTLRMPGTASGNILAVHPPSLNVEFGHHPGQEGPEIPSWGWSYYDLKVEMFQ